MNDNDTAKTLSLEGCGRQLEPTLVLEVAAMLQDLFAL